MEVSIVEGWRPGALGRIVELHGSYYHRKAGFGLYFEVKVARELAAFLAGFEPGRDGLWLVLADGRVEGSVAIDGSRAPGEGAHLRWFIMSERLRGQGAGRALLGRAIGFCRERGFPGCQLWTFAGLDAAAHLYREHGFVLVEQRRAAQWGVEVDEQRYELALGPIRA